MAVRSYIVMAFIFEIVRLLIIKLDYMTNFITIVLMDIYSIWM